MPTQTQEKTKRNILLFISVSTAVMLVIIIAAIVPAIKKLEQLKKESEGAQAAIVQQASTYHRLITLSKEGKNLEEKMTFINNLFLTKPGTLAYIQSLENAARERSITLELSLSESTGEEAFSYNTVNIQVQGPWQNVYSFLLDVENIRPITTTTSLTLQSGSVAGSENASATGPMIAVTIAGKVPFFHE